MSENIETSAATAVCGWIADASKVATSLAEAVAWLELETAVALRLELEAGERIVCAGTVIETFLDGHAGVVVQIGAIERAGGGRGGVGVAGTSFVVPVHNSRNRRQGWDGVRSSSGGSCGGGSWSWSCSSDNRGG